MVHTLRLTLSRLTLSAFATTIALTLLLTHATPASAQETSHGPTQVSLGAHFGCGVGQDGSVRCWGRCDDGQCGAQTDVTRTPQVVQGLENITSVKAGYGFACALRSDGAVLCWGNNEYGQLGIEGPDHRATPEPVPGLANVTELALGGFHACALRSDGKVLCWGGNTYANLGAPEPAGSRASVQVVRRLPAATHIWAGQYHTCAQDEGGRMRCWGGSSYLQCGTRRRVRRAPVTRVRRLVRPASIALGGAMGCATTTAGDMRCWGSNIFNAGDGEVFSTPQTLTSIHHVEGVAIGGRNLCAISRGRVLCWGVNDMEQLGVPTEEAGHIVSSPVAVPGLEDAIEIELGAFAQCVRRRTAGWVCWGYNARGGVGVGSNARLVTRPTPLPW